MKHTAQGGLIGLPCCLCSNAHSSQSLLSNPRACFAGRDASSVDSRSVGDVQRLYNMGCHRVITEPGAYLQRRRTALAWAELSCMGNGSGPFLFHRCGVALLHQGHWQPVPPLSSEGPAGASFDGFLWCRSGGTEVCLYERPVCCSDTCVNTHNSCPAVIGSPLQNCPHIT